MPKTLDNKNYCQGQLIYVRITKLYTDNSFTKVLKNMFLIGLIFLNQHHIDGGIRRSEVKDEIMSIIKRT